MVPPMSRFNIQSLDLNLLSVFVILWDTRSVSRASERLALTQPAVSHALRRLRDRLGDELFVPARQGIVPTPRAAELVVPIREALQQISDALSNSSSFDPASSSMEYRIATTDLVESWLIPMLLELTHRTAPGIVIRSVPLPEISTVAGRLEVGDVDLAISQEPAAGTGVQCEALTEIGLVTMIRQQDAPRTRKFPLKMYLERPHVVFQRNQPGGGKVDRQLKAMGNERRVGAEVKTFYTVLATAARTGYICTVPAHMARFAHAFDLSVHETPFQLPPIPLFLAWHARYADDAALGWLLANVRQAVVPSGKGN
jgi:DNA-binding transcriptional LysR family regulator